MRRSLLKVLRAPKTAELLTLYTFESEESSLDSEENIIEGILLARTSDKAYPILGAVPVMLESSFTQEFLRRHEKKISQDEILSRLNLGPQSKPHWSFSREWDVYFDFDLIKTWGWTVGERIQQFFLEIDMDSRECEGKLTLDAGCGNGQLSECLSCLGTTVIGLDYSNSVRRAEERRKSPNVHFVQGDLQSPPFDIGTFDLIISNGVLHHTPDTYKTFVEVAKLVKPAGRFYLWLYRKPEAFLRRYFLYPLLALMRMIVSRTPARAQKLLVETYAIAFMVLHRILGKYKDYSWQERVVGAFDALTPRWVHYHTALEVSCWFFLTGYSSPTITHWDNPYGFGMVGTKKPQEDTPGTNFGKRGLGKGELST